MKRMLLVLVLSTVLPAIVSAQDDGGNRHDEHTVTSNIGPSARYEIVQSTLAGKFTFKLDKQLGFVWLLVHITKDDSYAWEFVKVEELNPGSKSNHFQLFMSGLAGKFAFLLDTDSGSSWQYAESIDKNGERTSVFQKLPEV